MGFSKGLIRTVPGFSNIICDSIEILFRDSIRFSREICKWWETLIDFRSQFAFSPSNEWCKRVPGIICHPLPPLYWLSLVKLISVTDWVLTEMGAISAFVWIRQTGIQHCLQNSLHGHTFLAAGVIHADTFTKKQRNKETNKRTNSQKAFPQRRRDSLKKKKIREGIDLATLDGLLEDCKFILVMCIGN